MRITYFTTVFAVLAFTAALAGDEIDREFLRMIKEDISGRYAKNCEISIEEVISQLVGNNGRRAERWRIKACDFSLVYDVEYYPPSHFPDRENDKLVRLIID